MTNAKLRRAAVSASTLRRAAVTPSKVHPRTIALFKGQQGAAGAAGPKGDPGAPGAQGPKGDPGTARAFVVVGSDDFSGPGGACRLRHARNIVGARRVSPGTYCVKPAAGIDVATSGSAAGVDYRFTNPPEGNASALMDSASDREPCPTDEYAVFTERIPAAAPVVGGTANTAAAFADDVAFWLLVL